MADNKIDIKMTLDSTQVDRGLAAVKRSFTSLDRSLRAGTELGAKFGLGFLTAQGAAMLLKNEIQHVIQNMDKLPGISQESADTFRGMSDQMRGFRQQMDAVIGQMIVDAPAQLLALFKGQAAAAAMLESLRSQGQAIREANEALVRRQELEKWFGGEGAKIRENIANAAIATYALDDQITIRKIALRNAMAEADLKRDALDPLTQANELEKLRLETEQQRLVLSKEIGALEIQSAQQQAEQDGRRIALNQALLNGSFAKTEQEKWPERKRLLDEQLQAQQQLLNILIKKRAAASEAGDLGAVATFDTAIGQAGAAVDQTQQQAAALGANPASTVQNLQKAVADLGTSLGSTAQMAARAVGTIGQGAVSSLQTALTGFITKSGTGLKGLALSFGESMLNAITRMGAEWVVQQGIMLAKYIATKSGMFAIDTVFAAKSLALSMASAAKSLIAWIPSAIAAAISSYGIAAAIGVAAVGAALFLADGGPVSGPGTGRSDSIPAYLSNGEYVIPAERVDQYGQGMFDAIRSGNFSTSASASASPAVGGGGGSLDMGAIADRVRVVVVPPGDHAAARRIERQSRARGDIVRIVSEDFGIDPKSGA